MRRSLLGTIPLGILAIVFLFGCKTTTQPAEGYPIIVETSPKSVTMADGSAIEVSAHVTNSLRDSTVTWILINIGSDNTAGSLRITSANRVLYTAVRGLTVDRVVLLRARSNEDPSRYYDCAVTITKSADTTPAQPVHIEVSPLSVTIPCAQAQPFHATIVGSQNGHVHWRMTPSLGSIMVLDSTGCSISYVGPASIPGVQTSISIEAVSDADTHAIARATITIQKPPPPPTPCFRTAVHPILITNCTIAGCHNPQDRTARIDFTTYGGVLATLVPGDTNQGLLFHRLHDVSNPLTAPQIAIIGAWIMGGAPNSQCPEPNVEFEPSSIHYSTFVQPVVQNYCLGCHSGKNATVSAGIDLTTFEAVQEIALSGQLRGSIEYLPFHKHMPLYGQQLDAPTIARIKAWIERGAPND